MRKLQRAFQTALIHDLDDDDFADMVAQTITYGLFSVSVRRTFPGEGTAVTREDIPHYIFTSPFLKEMMTTFLGLKSRKGKIDFDRLGIADITDVLQSSDTKMDRILDDFNNRNPQEDPVIHFYELFLTEYDRQKKIQRGVFYTPQPVVSYIVRSVHELLQTEFGLADGLADTTTWGEMLKKHPDLKLPPLTDEPGEKRSVSPDEPFVQILDPATGTATFLVEVIDVVHRTLAAKWKQQRLTDDQQRDAWNDYVPKHLLPRLHAFELMMAPYAIAHMKIGLKLAETGYRFGAEERARIYLTNALEPWVKQLPLIGFDALAHEAAAVNEIKRYKRFTVVIGNPPYSGESMNKGEWIRKLIDDYMYVAGEHLNEKGKKNWLQDDYVKFLRFSQWLIQQSDIGVVGLITNHSYLDNPTFRGMRASLIDTFGGVSFLDLHGNSKKKEQCPDGSKDENVFDILVGVAVGLFVRTSCKAPHCVEHSEIWGLRPPKYQRLLDSVNSSTNWNRLSPSLPFFVFTPQDVGVREEYERTWKITEAFPHWGAGIITSRDHFIIDFDDQPIRERLEVFRNASITDDRVREELRISDNSMWSMAEARREFSAKPINDELFVPCLYRPFDTRRIYFETNVVFNMRIQVMRHMLAGGNLGFNIGRAGQVIDQGEWNIIFCTPSIAEFNLFRRGGNSLIPLYIYPDTDNGQASLGSETERRPNLSHSFLKAFAVALGVPQKGAHQLPTGLTPEDIFHYAYAVFHSPGYRSRYAEFLKIDFPRLPLTGNLELFRALARLGGELTALHLVESPKLDKKRTEFIWGAHAPSRAGLGASPKPIVEKVSYSKNTVWIDKAQTTGFRGVPEDVWNFHIGGYQVCEKWLKDRKGRTLSKGDIVHYQKIVTAIAETIRLMKEIDKVIEKHGGWPGAFAGNA
jgi:predicted helicase